MSQMVMKLQVVINANSQDDYKKKLDAELEKMRQEEIWQVGKKVRESAS